jgi:NAD(P)-dependent dehydrogenase (short-subunit alcohol dehydrogenase family)
MSPENDGLSGRVALVSGGSQGIGLGIASALAGAGARVSIIARSATVDDVAASIHREAIGIRADVGQPGDVEDALHRTEEALGPVDLLVHNAGTADVIGPLWQADPDAWWNEVAGHLRGAMLLCRAVLPGMLQRRRGRILLMYGNLGEGGDPWSSAYACGKAGLLRLVDQLCAELEGTGVHIFGVHPGLVWTPMTRALAEDPEKRQWLPRFSEWPRSRFGTPDAVSDLAVRIGRGEADALSGLLLAAGDAIGELTAEVEQIRAEHRRTLRAAW